MQRRRAPPGKCGENKQANAQHRETMRTLAQRESVRPEVKTASRRRKLARHRRFAQRACEANRAGRAGQHGCAERRDVAGTYGR
jgi:hypothetical protein